MNSELYDLYLYRLASGFIDFDTAWELSYGQLDRSTMVDETLILQYLQPKQHLLGLPMPIFVILQDKILDDMATIEQTSSFYKDLIAASHQCIYAEPEARSPSHRLGRPRLIVRRAASMTPRSRRFFVTRHSLSH